jgi:hypothetical protein
VNRLSKEKMQLEVDKHKLETQLQHCPAHHQLVLDLSGGVVLSLLLLLLLMLSLLFI